MQSSRRRRPCSSEFLPADAKITSITIDKTEPFAGGASFGEAGAYVKITGTAKGELDPADARNKIIVNLDKAPRNAAGKVEYEVEFYIMRPADPAKGSGTLLYEVNNRGKKLATLYPRRSRRDARRARSMIP